MRGSEINISSETGVWLIRISWLYRVLGLILMLGALATVINFYKRYWEEVDLGVSGSTESAMMVFFGLFLLLPAFLLLFINGQITIDPRQRLVTENKGLIFFSSKVLLPFDEIDHVAVVCYRGITIHGRSIDHWRVDILPRGRSPLTVNLQGRREEMTDQARRLADLIGVPFEDRG